MRDLALEPPPLLKGAPLVGSLPALVRNPLGFMEGLAHEGPVVRVRLGPSQVVFVNDPELAGEVQVTRVDEFTKEGPHKERLRPLLGDSLPVIDGDVWKRRRRLMNPMFAAGRLRNLSARMTDVIAEHYGRWQELCGTDRTVDLSRDLAEVAMQVLTTTMFTRSLTPAEEHQLSADFRAVTRWINVRLWTPFLPSGMPVPRERAGRRALARIEALLERVVGDRRAADGSSDDLLGLLLDARDEDGAALDDTELRDELMALLFGGHETTATTVTWTLAMLLQHSEWEERVRAEVDAELDGRTPGMEDWPRLRVTKACWEEAMRMFPPAFTNGRMAPTDLELGGHRISAGTMVMLNVYGTHHHPGHWEDPHRFDPGRMMGDAVEARNKWAHYPFGVGPRHCIAANMANMEALYLLSMLYQRFDLRLAAGADLTPRPMMSIQPKGGVPVHLSRRGDGPDLEG